MTQKVLVMGGTGMLGHMVYTVLDQTDKYKMFNAVFRNKLTEDSIICDVKDQSQLKNLFEQTRPDIVINCVGALVKESIENPGNAIYLNALLPHILADFCTKNKARLIHISTDCVFSGKKGNYAESDYRDADDVYGRSKALGEISGPKVITLRTSIIGPEIKTVGQGLFHWFMNQNGDVNGFTNAIWSGITTLELAKSIKSILDTNEKGIFHVTNGDPISKFHLLSLIKEEWCRNDVTILPFDSYIVNKSLLKSTKFNFMVPSYKDMMSELKFFMDKSTMYSY